MKSDINICMQCGSTNIISGAPNNMYYCCDCKSRLYLTITKKLLERLYSFNGKVIDGFQLNDSMLTVFLKDYKPYYDKTIGVEFYTGVDVAFIQIDDILKIKN